MKNVWVSVGPSRQATILACLIWLASFLMESFVAVGFVPMALVWSLHGLALMLVMKGLLERVASWPRWPRTTVFIIAPIVFAYTQTFLDALTTYWAGGKLLAAINAPPPGMTINPLDVEFWLMFRVSSRIYLWMFGFYTVILALLWAMRSAYQARLDVQKTELEALRLQVNPHFLFNALNSVSSLILARRHTEAEAMTLSLARFYRNTLAAEELPLTPVGQELDAVLAYIELEQERLGERLTLDIDCPDDLHQAQIPALLLHPIVENAVKHGAGEDAVPLPITLTLSRDGDRLQIVVENPLAIRSSDAPGAGVGLDNVRRRLKAAYGPEGVLETLRENDLWRVRVLLPLEQVSPST